MAHKWILVLGCGLICLPATGQGGDWPQFRGPGNAGWSAEKQLPAEWGKDKNVQWKAPVPGYGWSSPIVVGDKVFVTTAVSDKQRKPSAGFGGGGGGFRPGGGRPDLPKDDKGGERPKGPPGGFPRGGPGGGFGNQKPPDAVYRWEVYCLNRADGKVLWKQTAVEGKPTIATHGSNTYASETPLTDGERVYAYFGMTGLFCYDLEGKRLWSKDVGSHPMMMGWGTGSSPALDGERVFVQCDNEEKSFLVAFDKRTGEERWRAEREEKSSWCTPFVWRNNVRTELVAAGGRKVRSYEPSSGKLLWELSLTSGAGAGGGGGGRPGMGFGPTCNATPVASEELLYVGTGGPMGGSPLFAVRAGAAGDITPKEGETSNAGVAWHRDQAGPSMASPLLYDGYLYILEQRNGQVSCYDAKTGEPAYKRERLAGARGFTSSPWAYDGKVFCLDDGGQTFVIRAGKEFKLLGKNELGEMCWSTPAIAGGRLILRSVDHVYCIKP